MNDDDNTRDESEPQAPGRKLPFLQFYTKDWRSDEELRACGLAARGLWMELICLMHTADPRGYLIGKDGPPNSRQLTALVGATEKEIRELLAELERNGVFSRTESGVIFSRKMVKSARISAEQRARVLKRWRPDNAGEIAPGINAGRKSGNTETIPNARANTPATHRLRDSETDSSESDGSKSVLAELRKYPDGDYDGWKMALAVLKYLGPIPDGPARAFLAKTKNAHSLSPKMLAEIALATWTAKAEEPRSYMVDQAKRQRAEADSDPADDYWPVDFQDREVERFKRGVGLWPSDLGAQPGSNLCRIDPTILEKYGFPVPTWRAAEKS